MPQRYDQLRPPIKRAGTVATRKPALSYLAVAWQTTKRGNGLRAYTRVSRSLCRGLTIVLARTPRPDGAANVSRWRKLHASKMDGFKVFSTDLDSKMIVVLVLCTCCTISPDLLAVHLPLFGSLSDSVLFDFATVLHAPCLSPFEAIHAA